MKPLLLVFAISALSACSAFLPPSKSARPFVVVHSLEGVPLTRLFALFGNRTALDEIQAGFGRHRAIRTVRWARGDYWLEVTCFGTDFKGRWIVTQAQERRKDSSS